MMRIDVRLGGDLLALAGLELTYQSGSTTSMLNGWPRLLLLAHNPRMVYFGSSRQELWLTDPFMSATERHIEHEPFYPSIYIYYWTLAYLVLHSPKRCTRLWKYDLGIPATTINIIFNYSGIRLYHAIIHQHLTHRNMKTRVHIAEWKIPHLWGTRVFRWSWFLAEL